MDHELPARLPQRWHKPPRFSRNGSEIYQFQVDAKGKASKVHSGSEDWKHFLASFSFLLPLSWRADNFMQIGTKIFTEERLEIIHSRAARWRNPGKIPSLVDLQERRVFPPVRATKNPKCSPSCVDGFNDGIVTFGGRDSRQRWKWWIKLIKNWFRYRKMRWVGGSHERPISLPPSRNTTRWKQHCHYRYRSLWKRRRLEFAY